jgi:hypothetical protein
MTGMREIVPFKPVPTGVQWIVVGASFVATIMSWFLGGRPEF